jgi:hypothetical protein
MSNPPPPNVGTDLFRVHKVITRSLTVSLQHSQASGPVSELHVGYQRYLQAFVSLLTAHHQGEEEIVFPYWRQKYPLAPYDQLIKQHEKIVPLLTNVHNWLITGSSGWDIQSMMDLHNTLYKLQGIWRIHFPIEEAHFGYQNSLIYLTPEENAMLSSQWTTHRQQHAIPSDLVIPFMLYNMPLIDREIMEQLLPQETIQQLIPTTWKATWAPM